MVERRAAWVATLLSLLHPGLGQLYLGRDRRAVLFFVTFPAIYLSTTAVAVTAPSCTAAAVLGALVVVVPLYLANVVDAFLLPRRRSGFGGPPAGRWKLVIPLFFALTAMEEIESFLVRSYWLEPFVTPTGSMMPTLLPGDRFYVDKRSGGSHAFEKGDLAVFTLPEEPDVRYIKRIVAVEGEMAPLPGGPGVVPPGTVFLLGDNREDSRDSRQFGPVLRQRLEGKATQIWFSWDEKTHRPRWNRIGKSLR